MIEDEMIGWHPWFNGHEYEQALGDGEGQWSLACGSPWGHKESEMTEWLNNNNNNKSITLYYKELLFLFSCSVLSDSLWPHGLQHPRLPCLQFVVIYSTQSKFLHSQWSRSRCFSWTLAFSMIQRMLAIWSLVPLLFQNPACTSEVLGSHTVEA